MRLRTLCTMAAMAAPLFAGKLIEMDSVNLANNQTTTRQVMIDVDKLAIVDGRSKIVFRTDGGRARIQVLESGRNEYIEIDEATMKELGDTMAAMSTQVDAAFAKMDENTRKMMEKMMKGKMPTGAPAAVAPVVFSRQGNGTVAGFACTRYRGTQSNQTAMDVCASTAAALKISASEYGVFDKMREFTKDMQQAVKNSPFGGAMTASAVTSGGFEGFPVEQTIYANGAATTKDTLKSITDKSFTDADFSMGNAKKTELPLGNQGRRR